jgi:hypothetical protein
LVDKVSHTLEVCHTGEANCGIAHGAQFFLKNHTSLVFNGLCFHFCAKIAHLLPVGTLTNPEIGLHVVSFSFCYKVWHTLEVCHTGEERLFPK